MIKLCLFSSPDYENLFSTLKLESNQLKEWFRINKMQANSGKFQMIAVGKKTFDMNPTIEFQKSKLTCEKIVKLLGIEIDYRLKSKIDIRIGNICRKPA